KCDAGIIHSALRTRRRTSWSQAFNSSILKLQAIQSHTSDNRRIEGLTPVQMAVEYSLAVAVAEFKLQFGVRGQQSGDRIEVNRMWVTLWRTRDGWSVPDRLSQATRTPGPCSPVRCKHTQVPLV